MKKRGVRGEDWSSTAILLLVVLLLIPILVLGVSYATNPLTGQVTSRQANLSIRINAPPVIFFVSNVTPQSITEASTTLVNFSFTASDADGAADINNNSAQLRIMRTGETDRVNLSCHPLALISATAINYSCSVYVWYFDGAGPWTVNASLNDTAGQRAENASRTFELQETAAMALSPTALTWATLPAGFTNQTSNNDPITVNNTGNKNIAAAGFLTTGYNLQGLSTLTDFINAQNFSVSPVNGTPSCTGVACLECNGTLMSNNTAQSISSANLTRGNNTINQHNQTSGQEDIFFCLRTVPTEIARQVYDTTGSATSAWVVEIS
ncbi:MAG: hypothetical protein Q8R53_00605 [Nanoarchaeota archaeon]|nr:hypothetical protein [Nanoarchaeota archaeon]